MYKTFLKDYAVWHIVDRSLADDQEFVESLLSQCPTTLAGLPKTSERLFTDLVKKTLPFVASASKRPGLGFHHRVTNFEHFIVDELMSDSGENVAGGSPTPEAVMQNWLGSDGHCAGIMNSGSNVIGIGYHYVDRNYATQVFGRVNTQ